MAGVVIPKLHGRFSITSLTNTLAVRGFTTGTLRTFDGTVADYFIRGHTGTNPTDSNQLLEHLQAGIRAIAGTDFDGFYIEVSNAGIVTMRNTTDNGGTGENFRIESADVGLISLLGYDTGVAPFFVQPSAYAASHVAGHQHRYGWYPNTGIATSQAHPSRRSMPSSDARVHRAPSGRVVTTAYDEFGDNEFEFRWVEDEYLVPVGLGGTTITNRDFETFWRDVLRIGERFRFYPDRTVQTAPGGGATWEYVGDEKIVKDGLTKARLEADNYSRYWRFVLDVMNYSAT